MNIALTPEQLAIVVLVLGAVVVLGFVQALASNATTAPLIGIVALIVAVATTLGGGPVARLAVGAIAVAAAVGLLLVPSLELERPTQRPEVVALILLGAAGAIALATGTDVLQLVLGLETLSLSVAVLVSLGSGERPLEAAFRYFVLAAISLASFLYGIGLLYLSTGSLALPGPGALLGGGVLFQAGVVLIALGVVFELAVVPLQWGLLDAYTAAPPAVAGYAMATAKLGAVIALARLISGVEGVLNHVFIAIGVLSIAWGTFGALAQRDLRRMLAYSAVVNAGFSALALGCGPDGRAAAIFYVVTYAATSLLIFASLAGRGTGPLGLSLISTERLGPLRAAGLALGLLSLSGIPPAPGFWAKLAVLWASWYAAGVWPTVIAVLGGVAGVLYYLRALPDLLAAARQVEIARPLVGSAVVLAGIAVVVLGLVPGLAWTLAGLAGG